MSAMHRPAPTRRRLLGFAALALLAAAGPAGALDAAVNKVILTVTGPLEHRNQGDRAVFDLALIQRLPQHSFSTRTPWYKEPRKFTGVLFTDLLAAVGAPDIAVVRAVALNDYRVEIPRDDLTDHGAMLAYLLDDKPMSVREKGPLVIIYPFDDDPELRTPVRYSRAVWQLKSLELQ
jgi:hypothetical protein